MGCVSSNLFNHDGADDFPQIGSSALSHHIVSLTSSTYGLLTLDPPSSPSPMTPPPRFTFGSIFPASLSDSKSLWFDPRPLRSDPEVINSWELMAGLEPRPKPVPFRLTRFDNDKENSNPNRILDRFETRCPPGGEEKAILYTTSLRGVRKTFEACNAVRSAVENLGVVVCERDVSMDRGFREELKELMKKGRDDAEEAVAVALPRLFVKGRDVGGFDEVMRIVEEGLLGEILEGLPRRKAGEVCQACGAARFLPCFECNGSAKMVVKGGAAVVKCPECNENGLVLCPICG